MNILIIDDNDTNRLVLKYMVQNKNQNIVSEAENGKKAIEMIKKNGYDIIFMDMMMPVMDGYETTKYIRKNLNKDVPIYIVSAYQEQEFPDEWKTVDYNGLIPKPILLHMVTDVIDKYSK